MAAKILEEKISMLDSAVGPVRVTSQLLENVDIDDFVSTTVVSKAEFLRALTKIAAVNPQDTVGRPPVRLDGNELGGHDA